MKDELQKFIQKNRASFDDQEPSETIWDAINQSLHWSRSLWHSARIWRAAAFLLLGVTGYIIIYSSGSFLSERKESALIQREVADLNTFYANQLAEKVSLIEGLSADDYEQFAQDLQKLEAMYQVLLEELKTSPSPQVKDAIVLSWLVRIDLLNQQIHKMEKGLPSKKSERPSKV
jgi:hypothetical protein